MTTNNKIFELAEELKSALAEQALAARKALDNLPAGETRTALEGLLNKAASGKMSAQDVQKEVQKIMRDAN